MSAKIVAVRCRLVRDRLQMTTVGSSPRGTKVLVRSVMVEGLRGPKKEFDDNIAAAILELLPQLEPAG